MNMVNPDVMIDGKGVIVISSDQEETESNEGKLLKDLSIVDGCILKVDDFFQNYELTVTVIHKHAKHDESRFEIIADKDVLKAPVTEEELKASKEPQPGPSGLNDAGRKSPNGYKSEEDDVMCIDSVAEPIAEKRKNLDIDEEQSTSCKRARIEPCGSPAKATTSISKATVEEDEDLICIDDD